MLEDEMVREEEVRKVLEDVGDGVINVKDILKLLIELLMYIQMMENFKNGREVEGFKRENFKERD